MPSSLTNLEVVDGGQTHSLPHSHAPRRPSSRAAEGAGWARCCCRCWAAADWRSRLSNLSSPSGGGGGSGLLLLQLSQLLCISVIQANQGAQLAQLPPASPGGAPSSGSLPHVTWKCRQALVLLMAALTFSAQGAAMHPWEAAGPNPKRSSQALPDAQRLVPTKAATPLRTTHLMRRSWPR